MMRCSMVVCVMLALTGMAFADVDPLEATTDEFSVGLEGLKNSADQLTRGNFLLAEKITGEKSRLNRLQTELMRLNDENGRLARTSLKLQESNAGRARKITELEKESFEADKAADKISLEIKARQEEIQRLSAQRDKVGGQLKDMGSKIAPTPAPPPAARLPQSAFNPEKEKLKLLKAIEDSKQQQSDLYAQIASRVRQAPSVTVESTSDTLALERQIKQEENEIEQWNKISTAASTVRAGAWTQEQMETLEKEVRILQKNHGELEDLVAQMQKKARKASPQTQDEERLSRNLEDSNKEVKKLKSELYVLRQQMVQLDKRKTRLEAKLQN